MSIIKDGLIFYDIPGYYFDYAYIKINDVFICKGASDNQNYIVSKTGSVPVNKGDVVKYKGSGTSDVSLRKIIFVPFKIY